LDRPSHETNRSTGPDQTRTYFIVNQLSTHEGRLHFCIISTRNSIRQPVILISSSFCPITLEAFDLQPHFFSVVQPTVYHNEPFSSAITLSHATYSITLNWLGFGPRLPLYLCTLFASSSASLSSSSNDIHQLCIRYNGTATPNSVVWFFFLYFLFWSPGDIAVVSSMYMVICTSLGDSFSLVLFFCTVSVAKLQNRLMWFHIHRAIHV
jgi:hypothetical protein